MFKKAFAAVLTIAVLFLSLCGFAKPDWRTEFDTALPDLEDGKWTETMHTDFTQIHNLEELEAANWAPSPHGLRKYEYWCPQMIAFSDKGLIIHSEQQTNHTCDVCGKNEGIFTSGIETRKTGEDGKMLFEQAFGYFEATVIVPRGTGMWSAFWMQGDGTGRVGHKGRDGSEIDIYESSFGKNNPTKTGQAIHYDAYNYPWYHSEGNVTDTGKNLYDGQPHTYALKWSPDAYVIYVDGEAVWASDYGDVCRVPEYLRLTVEIRDSLYGPYGEEIALFRNHEDGRNDFVIQDVKVYQNSDYLASVENTNEYRDLKKTFIALIVLASVLAAGIVLFVLVILVKKIIAKKKGK